MIGGGFYWSFVSGNNRKGRTGAIALETTLGWVLSGNAGVSSFRNKHVSPHILKLGCAKVETSVDTFSKRDQILLNEVKKFWEIEDVNSKPCMNRLDQGDKIHESFKSSVEFEDGHYTVGLPWITDTLMLPDNFAPSKQRLESLVRLKCQPALLKKYDDIIKDQEKTGIIEPVNDLEIVKPGEIHYIPHTEVVRDDHATTKVRIVYDASANKNGLSLNKMLETGPCLLPKIFEILRRVRCHKFLLVSDIQSAFLNIRVKETDRNSLRFLWIDDLEKDNPNVVIKCFTSVVFGLNCSPFLMSATVQNHMQKHCYFHSDVIL